MSTIAISIVFLKETYGPAETVLLENILKRISNKVIGSRKGRYWEIANDNVVYYIDVRKTESRINDCEEELLELNLIPEEVPEVIFITSSLGRENDLAYCNLISNEIITNLNGITNGAVYSS